MTNEIAIPVMSGMPADLSGLSVGQLRSELTRALRMTVDSLVRTAWIIRLLEEKGEDLSDIRLGILGYLRKIAHGQVAAEVMVRFAERPMILQRVASLPMPDQIRIASGGSVPLVVSRPEGKFDVRMADPLSMTRDQLMQVFSGGSIRDEAEQILLLEDRQPKPAGKKGSKRKATIEPDHKRGGLVIGKRFFPTADILAALADLAGEPDASEADIAVPVKLTKSEHFALKNAANRSGTGSSMNILIRRALMLSGLFAGE